MKRLRYYAHETVMGSVAGGLAFYFFGWRRNAKKVEKERFEGHRPYSDLDAEYLRNMKGQKVPQDLNPGVRITEDFISEEESKELELELRNLVAEMGYNQIDDFRHDLYSSEQKYLENPPNPNMMRITGRFELKEQPIAPWGYGFELDRSKLPPHLLRCVNRIEQSGEYALGALLDVTVNFRKERYFRTDPHVDPMRDGPTVFILPLLSDSVLTLSPIETKGMRKDYESISELSYTGDDVDCLLKKNNLQEMNGAARWMWTHGIRNGTEYPDIGLADWFGTPRDPVQRNDDRFSIIFSFAPHQDFEAVQFSKWRGQMK